MKTCDTCKKEITSNGFLGDTDDCIQCCVNKGLWLCETCCETWFDPSDNFGENGNRLCENCHEQEEHEAEQMSWEMRDYYKRSQRYEEDV